MGVEGEMMTVTKDCGECGEPVEMDEDPGYDIQCNDCATESAEAMEQLEAEEPDGMAPDAVELSDL